MPKVSVIIPVYNVESYLAKCLDSVCGQTLTDIEIICVNDCSPDNSFRILDDYAAKDVRITIINREQNGGLSAARNTGLDVAQGEYIYFIDSDDWIDLDYVEKMYNAAIKTAVAIVLNTNIIAVSEYENKPFIWSRYEDKLEEGEFLTAEFSISHSQCMTWAHLYKKSFIDQHRLRFPEGCIHEDNYFKAISEIHTNKIFAFYGPSYYYLQRNNSIMSARKNKITSRVKVYGLIFDYYVKYHFLDKVQFRFFPIITECMPNEDEYTEFKEFLKVVKSFIALRKNLYNDLELFCMNTILYTNSYAEYFNKFQNKDMRINFIRYRKEFLDAEG